jgi:hypothetical protein
MGKISIGIRVTPSHIVYSILKENGDSTEIALLDKLNVPVALQIPEQLKFIRNTFIDIIYENKVNLACIRITESTSKQISIERVNMEAIIQELIASSCIEKYYAGQISSITAKIGIKRELFKGIIASRDCEYFEDWGKFNKEQKESLLAALSAFNL